MRIFRIRKYFLAKNTKTYIFTADVIASKWQYALKAAKENRIRNWKWVDKFDFSLVQYNEFEYMHPVKEKDAQAPARPDQINWKWRTA